MALIHNNLLSIFNGVSKQSLDQRLPNNCEEMINVYPTVQYGVRRRNPTTQVSTGTLVEPNQFIHSYDRGLSGESTEEYIVTIDRVNGLRVMDATTGQYNTVTYSGDSLKYLESSNPELGFSAITIKDTTFIANKDIIPSMYGTGINAGTGATFNYKSINVSITGGTTNYPTIDYSSGLGFSVTFPSSIKTNLAPARIKTFTSSVYYVGTVYAESSEGATTTITVDTVNVINYKTAVRQIGDSILPETIFEYRANIYSLLVSQLDQTKYRVVLGANGAIEIYKIDTTPITVTSSISYPSSVNSVPSAISKYSFYLWSWPVVAEQNIMSNAIVNITSSTKTGIIPTTSTNDREAFIWIKYASVDAAFPYAYTCSIFNTNGTLVGTHSYSGVNSDTIASNFYTWANTLTGFVAYASGSICKIQRIDGTDFTIVMSDTYGNQASYVFKGSITSMNDIPKNFPFKDTILKVDGVQKNDDIAYWIKYDGKTWVESIDPSMNNVIIDSSMPHKLVRNSDYTFTLSEINYNDITVRDINSQPIPEFIGSPIKDLFFVNGRFGILTKNGISLSQQGEFTNFFRTTVLTMLDDSAITTYIDSNKSVGLEYAVELQGMIILFGDKQQFAIDGNKGITPATLSVIPVAGYEINKKARPIALGNSILFLSSVGEYSSLLEMKLENVTNNILANDISSHVPNYLDSDIVQIVGSQKNSCVFLRSKLNKNTIYIWKYHYQGTENKQSAWSKWIFSSEIESIATFDKYLYVISKRFDETVPTDEFTFTETIKFDRTIIYETYISYGKVLANPSFERIDIDPYSVTALFKDNGLISYNSEIELSEWSLVDKLSVKELRGSLLIKTAMISSEEGSSFNLIIEDKERRTSRSIPALYTVGRKPYISGNAKNMKIKIKSDGSAGFQINSISLEGQYNARSTKL